MAFYPGFKANNGLTPLRDAAAESRLFSRRALVALALVLASLVTLVARLAYLQIVHHAHFTTLSESNRLKLQPLPPPRGLIFDRNGVLLADNLASQHLEVTAEDVPDLNATLEALKTRIALTDSDIERFRKLMRRTPSYNSVPLRYNLSAEEIARVAIDLYRFPGVEIKGNLSRYYPLGAHAVHIIGYVGRIDEQDLQRTDANQYQGSAYIGKIGIERSYEELLRGQAGYQQVEVNAEGRSLRIVERTLSTPGKHIYLSIDSRLQRVAEEALEGHNGAIVAIDPRNGEVLAMASMPAYDPNLFVNGVAPATYKALTTSPDRPLYNRALRGVYPPGSTIKPFVALAGLEYGVTNPHRGVICRGAYQLPGQAYRFRDWKRSGHGATSLDKGIAQSCDVYFYDLAFHLGIDRLHEYLTRFGLGRLTGIDLINEKTGLMPSPSWKRKVRNQPWYAGETLIAGIGQGYMLTTPLQLAFATATLAQGGQPFPPRLLHATRAQDSDQVQLEAARRLPPLEIKDPRNWRVVMTAMTHVVHGGGTAARIGQGSPYTMAGKTGTAQVFSLGQSGRYDARRLAKHLLDHALFIAFAPADEPRIAVAVIAEHGGGGSKTAAPIAKKVMDAYLLPDRS